MEERDKLVKEKVEEEDFVELMQQRGVRQFVGEILTREKGFRKDEITIDPKFQISIEGCETTVSIDFLITLADFHFAVIRCVNAGLDFWERYVTAFARSVADYRIPFAMVTNGHEARIIDVLSGASIGVAMSDFFNREQTLVVLRDLKKTPCPRLEKEKRIIYAFEGIKCQDRGVKE